ncbi:hypothetical protein [Christiangramia salexigens]|uniref:TonB C-terminal domain-containing protein n=1 Tax=Christiangramia salexigens TaxID=1913577 RepID=A0A1L3J5S9_9FLAO|nr:hypothetical protein [Christiangramia salexigens]APG60498.1 hypothetical protein LPB144_08815 [Christiangramia salexigens]
MKKALLPVLFLFIVSCNFETKKISSEEVLEQESRSLNWKEVDEYPTFKACQDRTELRAAKQCFETMVANSIYSYLASQNPVVSKSINDTLYIHLEITKEGKARIESVKIDTSITNQLPDIEKWLHRSIDSLPKIYPASKRGIPVSTRFKMPVVVKAE